MSFTVAWSYWYAVYSRPIPNVAHPTILPLVRRFSASCGGQRLQKALH